MYVHPTERRPDVTEYQARQQLWDEFCQMLSEGRDPLLAAMIAIEGQPEDLDREFDTWLHEAPQEARMLDLANMES